MMKGSPISGCCLLLLLSTVLGSNGHDFSQRFLKSNKITDEDESNAVLCQIRVLDIQFEDQASQREYRCVSDPSEEEDAAADMTYAMDLDDISGYEDDLVAGTLYASIPNGKFSRRQRGDKVVAPKGYKLSKGKPDQKTSIRRRRHDKNAHSSRRLVQSSGTSSVLVIRVIAQDGEPSFSAAELSDRIFGTNGDVVNLKSVYKSCSVGKLNFVPAVGRNIINGVTEITLNQKIAGMSSTDVDNEVVKQAEQVYGQLSSQFWHVMLCLPPGTAGGGWIAYAYINWYRSSYNDKWCGYPSAQVHEIGHNLGLQHSSEGTTAYGDQSGLMGYSYGDNEGPYMCFNGAKNWVLGWYDDRKIVVNPKRNGAWSGRLATFVDYSSTAETDHVLINVDDVYLQYNRQKGFNRGTKEKADQVTVTQTDGLGKESFSLAGLGNSDSYTYKDYDGGKRNLVIQVCAVHTDQVPNYVYLTIFIEDSQEAQCTEFSTSSPTKSPSMAPSARPSIEASVVPSEQPSSAPSAPPTVSPSTMPTSPPSIKASDLPTVVNSLLPSSSPTFAPSIAPTVASSGFPSSSPSIFQSDAPTLTGTARPSVSPSHVPSRVPTRNPSSVPSIASSWEPSFGPTIKHSTLPSSTPSVEPSHAPSVHQSHDPSYEPLAEPSYEPSLAISDLPSPGPTTKPTFKPTAEAPIPLTAPFSQPTIVVLSDAPSSTPSTIASLAPSTSPTYTQGSNSGCGVNEMRFSLSITTDQYPAETEWELTSISETWTLTGGPYNKVATEYTEDKCIPNDTYVLTMKDKYGDGLCCENGQGSYAVSLDGVNVMASEGKFRQIETSTLMRDCDAGKNRLMVQINTDFFGSETSWTLESLADGTELMSGGDYAPWDTRKDTKCLDASECYKFTIKDAWGDGMCCSYGFGGFSIDFAGDTQGGSFAHGYEEGVYIGTACPASAAVSAGPMSVSNSAGRRHRHKGGTRKAHERQSSFAEAQRVEAKKHHAEKTSHSVKKAKI